MSKLGTAIAATIALLGALTMALVLVVGPGGEGTRSHHYAEGSGIFVFPDSITTTIVGSDAIVAGTVLSVTDVISEHVATPDPGTERDPQGAVRYTYYEVEIDEVYLDDGLIGGVSETFTLAEHGAYPESLVAHYVPDIGEERLFFLNWSAGAVEDAVSLPAAYFARHWDVVITGTHAVWALDHLPIVYAPDATPVEYIEALQIAIAELFGE